MDAVPATTTARRFQELIAGHPYLIEVVPVSQDRWRAYIVRIPGVPNAMMPFYGQTADEAAAQLRQWLTRAYERAATAVRRV
jgi:IS1 family transposase